MCMVCKSSSSGWPILGEFLAKANLMVGWVLATDWLMTGQWFAKWCVVLKCGCITTLMWLHNHTNTNMVMICFACCFFAFLRFCLLLFGSSVGHDQPWAAMGKHRRPWPAMVKHGSTNHALPPLPSALHPHLLFVTYYLPLTTHYLLLTTYYILLTTYYLLRTTYYLLHTTYYLLLTTY